MITKVLGFGREVILSYIYGASDITDAYLISRTIPSTIFSFISAGIATGFIPMYSRILNEKGQLSANRFTSNLINTLLLLASIIVVFVLLFTQPIVKMFASGFSGETLILAVNFTRISIFGVYLTALINVFVGLLRLYENYVVPALITVPLNIIIIISLFISAKTSVYLIAAGNILAILSQLILLAPFLRKIGYSYKPVIDFKDQYIKSMILIALPVIVGTSVNEINVLVDRTLASNIAIGGIRLDPLILEIMLPKILVL